MKESAVPLGVSIPGGSFLPGFVIPGPSSHAGDPAATSPPTTRAEGALLTSRRAGLSQTHALGTLESELRDALPMAGWVDRRFLSSHARTSPALAAERWQTVPERTDFGSNVPLACI